MKNVSFDNPQLLLLLIPLAVIITVPAIIAMVKGVKTKAVVASYIIHLVIALAATLALAGMKSETVITKTEIYVVADVSYSSNRNLDTVDSLVSQVIQSAPENSSVGLVAFGAGQELLVPLGEPMVSVSEFTVDDSATNIADAISFAASKFSSDSIKRIVLITDGKDTTSDSSGRLVSAIESVYSAGIYIDAIYVDANLAEDDKELQVDDVQFKQSTYLNHYTTADVAVRSTYDTKAILHLYKNGERIESQSFKLTKGYNILNLPLDTSESGDFDYRIEISTDGIEDASPHNNVYAFTQSVAEEISILLVAGSTADVERFTELYGESASIDVCGSVNREPLPCEIEVICKYDEIVIANTDISELENYDAFINCLDVAVSSFGKTLMTLGDIGLQSTTDEAMLRLGDLLPVRFGNNDTEPKLYSIVIDTSRSLQDAYQLILAKQAAINLLSVLSDEDYVCVVAFSGDARVVQAPTKASNRADIARIINELEPSQGTLLGAALDETFKMIGVLPYDTKEVMLISDGRTHSLEPDKPTDVVKKMRQSGIRVSTLNVNERNDQDGITLLRNIAATGGGKYYYVETEEDLIGVIFDKIQDEISVTVVEAQSQVVIDRPSDESVKNVFNIPDINGYVYSSAKSSATTVLSTVFQKNEDETTSPPIYSYWDYGNGRVVTLTTSITGKWTEGWAESDGEVFLSTLAEVNTPDEKVDFPYSITVEYDGIHSTIEMIPTVLNPYAYVEIAITTPDGSVINATSNDRFAFDSSKYSFAFDTPELGKYEIRITYSYNNKSFVSNTVFNLSYSPEYDAFEIFSPSPLHAAVRSRGTVNYGTVPKLDNDEKEIETYVVTYVIPLLIIAICLYIIDIMVRKLKWNDIKGLFRRKKRTGGTVK